MRPVLLENAPDPFSVQDSTKAIAQVTDFTVTGIVFTVKTGNGDAKAEGNLLALKRNKIEFEIPKTAFDNVPEKVTTKLKNAAKEYIGISTKLFKAIAVGDASLAIYEVTDSLVVKGTVSLCKEDGTKTDKVVEVEFELDSVTPKLNGDPWLLPGDTGRIINAIGEVTKRTYSRDPKDLRKEIIQELEQEALK